MPPPDASAADSAPAPAADEARPRLVHRYLLLVQLPWYQDERGDVWLDRLWHRDFVAHLRYLAHLTVAAPRDTKRDQPGLVRVDVPDGVRLEFVALPRVESTRAALLALPRTLATLWRAIGRADIVHSGVAGWPIPIGWLANPIALLRRRRLVIVIESAPWRYESADGAGPGQRLRAQLTEWLARWATRRADLALFTQPAYRDAFMQGGRGLGVVTPATWIEEEEILEEQAARRAWDAKGERVRVLFAARLVEEKGVHLVLEAVRQLSARGVEIDLDVIGDGPLREACVEAGAHAERLAQPARLRLLDPVDYGAPFFALLRSYHAALVPSLGDEQPRIVFDAYAQAVPVLASDTDGLRPNVEEGSTGWLFERGNAEALAETLERATREPARLREMGLGSLSVARGATHRGMHARRHEILLERFGEGSD